MAFLHGMNADEFSALITRRYVLVIDPDEAAEWRQYESPDLFSPVCQVDGLAVAIEFVDEAARELVEGQPDLRRTETEGERSLEDTIHELQKRVQTRVAEQLTFVVTHAGAIVKIQVALEP